VLDCTNVISSTCHLSTPGRVHQAGAAYSVAEYDERPLVSRFRLLQRCFWASWEGSAVNGCSSYRICQSLVDPRCPPGHFQEAVDGLTEFREPDDSLFKRFRLFGGVKDAEEDGCGPK